MQRCAFKDLSMKRTALTALGWLVSVALIAILATKLDFALLWKELAKAGWGWLFLAASVNIGVIALKALRWKWMMAPAAKSPYGGIFRATMIGLAGNNLLPARGGDWYKIYLLGKWAGVTKAALASITGLDKLFDGLAILILFGLLSFHSRFPEWVRQGTTIVSIVIAVSLLICVALLVHHRRIPEDAAGELGRISRLAKNLGSGMAMLASRNLVISTILISIMICLAQVGTIWCCQIAFGQRLDIWVPALVYVAINLAIIVPSAPSGVGPFEVAAVLAYTWLGVGKEIAFNIALFYHAVQFLPVTAIGLVFYLKALGQGEKKMTEEMKDGDGGTGSTGVEAVKR